MRPSSLKCLLYYLALILLGQAFIACSSPTKLLETGQYDKAFSTSMQKLAGKKKKAKWVETLETSFARATERDFMAAQQIKREGNPSRMPEVVRIYEDITQRQNQLKPMLPLRDENGRLAHFEMLEVEGMLAESKQAAAEYLYARAQQLLREAGQGNRRAAREAYEKLEQTKTMIPSAYRDRDKLIMEAERLGVTQMLAVFDMRAPVILPGNFAADLFAYYIEGWSDPWTVVYSNPPGDVGIDIEMIFRIRQVEVSPESLQERERTFSREIEDGEENLVDSEGNIVRDSTGKVIKVPKKITVRARMLETRQHKAAHMQVELEWVDRRTGTVIDRQRRAAEALFEHMFATCRGDVRAIDAQLRPLCRERMLPFPRDATMLFDAAATLRPEMQRSMWQVAESL